MTLLDTPALPKALPQDHHGSHAQLLDPIHVEASPDTHVDAVIVPAARATESLETAIRLAKKLDAVCLALCSRHADAADAAALGRSLDAHVVAVRTSSLVTANPADDHPHPTRVLPDFEANRMLDDVGLTKNVDIALKRNLGLLLARLASCNRIFFLDDDVVSVNADHVTAAAALLHDYDAVGLYNSGFPDNSVVCHANREAFPGSQDQFISTMALALTIGSESFFPDIYNEDWFFFLGELPSGQWKPRLAATGTVVQKKFDPFADPERARQEEFGDTIAEGLFWLLDQQRPLESADREYWKFYLDLRRDFIDRIHKRILWKYDDRVQLEPRVAALEAAKKQNSSFTPEFCKAYVDAWRADLDVWRCFVDRLGMPDEPTIAGAIDKLGLTQHTYVSR